MKKVIIILAAVLTLSACELLKFEFAGGGAKATAYIYENRETKELLYCSNDQGNNVRDFKYVGTATVSKADIVYCDLEGGVP